ncbi:MAG: hypothetical protein AAGH89_02510 [Verrucomicrobiota bacterium]
MPNSVSFRQENPLRQLAQLSIQVQTGAKDLVGYELLLGEENISYVHSGAESMVETVQNLIRCCGSNGSEGNPLMSQDVRHDLRNQVAVVKGFTDLMKMDLPAEHTVQSMLGGLSSKTKEFVEVLDSIKMQVEDMSVQESLPMAS